MRCKCGSTKIEEVAATDVYLFTSEDQDRFQQWVCNHCGKTWVTEKEIESVSVMDGKIALKVAIVGSRSYKPISNVGFFVRQLNQEFMIVSGGAIGVDSAAEESARQRGMDCLIFPVNAPDGISKKEFTDYAYVRNQQIVDNADVVVAFWNGFSGGTANTIEKTRFARKPLFIIPQEVSQTEMMEFVERINQITQTALPEVTIYCDGACEPNPGIGGIGIVLLYIDTDHKTHQKTLSKAIGSVTNQIAEIWAATEGLKALKKPCKVSVFSDSQYVIKTMNGEWRKKTNLDHWQQLEQAAQRHQVQWNWIKGHNGNQYNEIANELAMQGVRKNLS